MRDYLVKEGIADYESVLTKLKSSTPDPNPSIEINTGISFVGISLHQYSSVKVTDFQKSKLGIKGNACLLAELASKTGEFIFKFDSRIHEMGKCHGCVEIKALEFKCKCNKIAYCSKEC
jgi:hypothetical protein